MEITTPKFKGCSEALEYLNRLLEWLNFLTKAPLKKETLNEIEEIKQGILSLRKELHGQIKPKKA